MKFLAFALCFFALTAKAEEDKAAVIAAKKKDPVAQLPPEGMVPANLLRLGRGETFSKYALIADKSTRTLSVWENNEGKPVFLQAHPMDIGKKAGDKTAENDLRTPEGIYFAQKILEGPGLNFDEYGKKAFTLDYPNFFDRREKKTGHGIWLHAIPETKTLVRGSRGCVVVRNEIIDELTPYIQLEKTPVIIADKVDYIPTPLLEEKKTAVYKWLEEWKQAWQAKDIEAYITMYGEDFKSLGMKRSTWKRYKDRLNRKYETISVKVINPIVIRKGDMVYIRFLQEYVSDQNQDFGEKTLFVKERSGRLEIVGEEWQAATGEILAQKEKYRDISEPIANQTLKN